MAGLIFPRRKRASAGSGAAIGDVWRRAGERVGARPAPGSSDKDPELLLDVGGRTLRVAREVVSSGNSRIVFTRARVLFRTHTGFRLKVVPRNLLHRIVEAFGGRDVAVGRPDFDRRFTVRTDALGRTRSLLTRGGIASSLAAHPAWRVEIKPARWSERRRFGDDVFSLQLHRKGLVRDVPEMEAFLGLARELMEGLADLSIASPRVVDSK